MALLDRPCDVNGQLLYTTSAPLGLFKEAIQGLHQRVYQTYQYLCERAGTISPGQNSLVCLDRESIHSIADEIESLVPKKEERPKLLFQIQTQLPSSVTYAPNWAP